MVLRMGDDSKRARGAWADPQGRCSHSGPPGLGLTGGRQEGQEVVGSCHHQESNLAPPNLVG